MRTIAAAAAAAFLVLAAQAPEAAAQAQPDFSGSWTLSESSGGPGGGGAARRPGGGGMRGGMGMMGGLGQTAAITHEEGRLVIVRATPMGEMRSVYNLDGSESRNTVTMGGNQVDLVSTARWDEGKLVIVTPISMGAGSMETRMTLSLDEAGSLVVETARSGGAMGGGQPMRAVYTRG